MKTNKKDALKIFGEVLDQCWEEASLNLVDSSTSQEQYAQDLKKLTSMIRSWRRKFAEALHCDAIEIRLPAFDQVSNGWSSARAKQLFEGRQDP